MSPVPKSFPACIQYETFTFIADMPALDGSQLFLLMLFLHPLNSIRNWTLCIIEMNSPPKSLDIHFHIIFSFVRILPKLHFIYTNRTKPAFIIYLHHDCMRLVARHQLSVVTALWGIAAVVKLQLNCPWFILGVCLRYNRKLFDQFNDREENYRILTMVFSELGKLVRVTF